MTEYPLTEQPVPVTANCCVLEWYMPIAHVVHEVLPAVVAYCPREHVVQPDAPEDALNWPRAHKRQAEAPVDATYWPAAHKEHRPPPGSYVPTLHEIEQLYTDD